MNDSPKSEIRNRPIELLAAMRTLAGEVLNGIIRMSSTRANYWLEFAFTGSLAFALLGAGVSLHRGSWLAAFFTVLAGLIAFSFIEYLFHRWIFHGPDSMYRRGHDAHHLNPKGYDGLPFFLPSAILLGLTALFALSMPRSLACLLAGTIALGYVSYGLSHFIIHARRFRHPWFREWAANHHIHHHHPDANFGVTSSLWDHLLRTRYQRQPRPHDPT
ncbi:MAG TPA: sterol desaturase family protein [Dokdonella sp.]|uniref:sterol desaturase family protein n=1 Tax=Dokdonella sp. TaxID=2291710 RepID=UPI002D80EF99|nr:sterol desaturase family protein [Dokdonella sp.]HET9032328.1 sterol desaturase family protein [Dokdonella sp.]